MKFYELAQAPDSMLRVGMDVVDESVRRNDFTGAREFIESNLLPLLGQLKLASYLIPVRSQHAVVLAYCSEFDAADAEMARLAPYEPGLPDEGRMELAMQRRLVGRLRREGPPPQWVMPPGTPTTFEGLLRMAKQSAPTRKVGRNAACPCGSGLKYKKCHGRPALSESLRTTAGPKDGRRPLRRHGRSGVRGHWPHQPHRTPCPSRRPLPIQRAGPG